MKKYLFNITAFDGEGATASGAGAEGVGDNGQVTADIARADSGSIDANATHEKSFDEYVKEHESEYKERFKKDFQKQFDRRHGDYKQLQARVKASDGIIEVLANKYGIDASDIDGIAKAVNDDNDLIEARAIEAGMTFDQYRNMMRVESENKRLRAEREQAIRQDEANRQYDLWMQQSNNLKQIFPDFNLEDELANPDFVHALQSGLTMERAFYAIHGADITSGAIRNTASAVRQATVQDMASRKNRPKENGIANVASVSVGKDIHKLTKADRAKLANKSILAPIHF